MSISRNRVNNKILDCGLPAYEGLKLTLEESESMFSNPRSCKMQVHTRQFCCGQGGFFGSLGYLFLINLLISLGQLYGGLLVSYLHEAEPRHRLLSWRLTSSQHWIDYESIRYIHRCKYALVDRQGDHIGPK